MDTVASFLRKNYPIYAIYTSSTDKIKKKNKMHFAAMLRLPTAMCRVTCLYLKQYDVIINFDVTICIQFDSSQ